MTSFPTIIDLTSSNIKTTSSVHDVNSPDPPFGSRFLLDPSLTFTQNAWDHVPPPDDQEAIIAESLERQKSAMVSEDERKKLNSRPSRYWDEFYKNNEGNFFKNRKWLHNEFPDLVAAAEPDAGPLKIAEIGCGAGNSIFPVLAANRNPELKLYAYDYSSHAVKVVQHNPLYISPPCGTIHSAVWDLSSSSPDTDLPSGLSPSSVDIIILVFVLSALHPDEWSAAMRNIHRMLKPGGKVFFRDYGRYDLTQLRFRNGRMIGDNFYKRGDGTRVYFFELDELSLLFTGKRLSKEEKHRANYGYAASTTQVVEDDSEEALEGGSTPIPGSDVSNQSTSYLSTPTAKSESDTSISLSTLSQPSSIAFDAEAEQSSQTASNAIHANTYSDEPHIHPNLLHHDHPFAGLDHPLFTTLNLGIDRRLIVNRKRQLKMYRVWMQGIFQKL
ncbi:S-adenosyl-L-methionine-dependent methyltransferase [Rhodocollybia butyracea]|uniref:S-adenosyl-L-methionine-dependent methyltransferase n=1 Tax=Rhodocollybia butyracea TaxID=206335 RepID=A0A9P5PC59_9AGAR|nr:S-adenosyl-L-methionine-dependent methyltransferase [Rhodocollybia butyracea]